MSHDSAAAQADVEIANALGLHLRPADKFAKLANSFSDTDIRVRHKGREFNGKSILELTMLGAECGTVLQIEARGPTAKAALDALVDLVVNHFHEDESGAEVAEPSRES